MKKIKLQRDCIFLSAHLDDAVFSCGGLISALAGQGKNVSVVTLFTRVIKGKNTNFNRGFVTRCGFSSEIALYKKMARKDKLALGILGSKSLHLGFIDAAWRQKSNLNKLETTLQKIYPEISFLYPTAKNIFSGKIVDKRVMLRKINKKLQSIVNKPGNASLFIPLGIGNHVDHLLTRESGQFLSNNLYYYEDFPYNYNFTNKKEKKMEINKQIKALGLNLIYQHQKNFEKKSKAIMLYPDSYNLFPGKIIPKVNERYYQ